MSADGQGLQRHRDRPRPANLDNAIDATAIGQFTRLLVPIGRLDVVDHVGGPQCLEPLSLLRGRGRRDHPSAQDPGKLQRKDRNAPRTLRQDGVTRSDFAVAGQRDQAVTAAQGKVAASAKERWLGRWTSASSLNTAYSPSIPSRLAPSRSVRYSGLIDPPNQRGWKQPAIRSPTLTRVTPLPIAATSPAPSERGITGR